MKTALEMRISVDYSTLASTVVNTIKCTNSGTTQPTFELPLRFAYTRTPAAVPTVPIHLLQGHIQ